MHGDVRECAGFQFDDAIPAVSVDGERTAVGYPCC